MMKQVFLFMLCGALLLGGCCEEEDAKPTTPPEVDCGTIDCPWLDEYAGSALLNGECWQTQWALIPPRSVNGNNIIIVQSTGILTNGIGEFLYLVINDDVDLKDTIWIGGFPSDNPNPQTANSWYLYDETLSPVGRFFFDSSDGLTYKDYLIIDYFNADTTIVEGRFQVKFPQKNVSNFITHEPDSMNIQCGHFRAKTL